MQHAPRSNPKAQKLAKGIVAGAKALQKPSVKQAALIGILVLLIGLVGTRVVGLASELGEVKAARVEMEGKRAVLEERHRDLEAQAQFVSDPDNLEQELRSRFNYKRPGENVVIVVPPKGATSTDE